MWNNRYPYDDRPSLRPAVASSLEALGDATPPFGERLIVTRRIELESTIIPTGFTVIVVQKYNWTEQDLARWKRASGSCFVYVENRPGLGAVHVPKSRIKRERV